MMYFFPYTSSTREAYESLTIQNARCKKRRNRNIRTKSWVGVECLGGGRGQRRGERKREIMREKMQEKKLSTLYPFVFLLKD